MSEILLELKGLNKIYPGGTHAVIDLDFHLDKGSICAILGPNGAGKSTSIGMICGLVRASSGSISFAGSKPDRSQIGVVSQHSNLELDLSALDNMKIHALLYGMKSPEYAERTESLLKLAGLHEKRHREVRSFSGGMKRKLQIVRALLHNPELIILDEPTVGLDPAARESIWDMILQLNRSGRTILFSTHYMEEAQRYARRVAILHRGVIIRDDNPEELIRDLGGWCRVTYGEESKVTTFHQTREEALREKVEDSLQLVVRQTTLEDLFIHLTGKELNL